MATADPDRAGRGVHPAPHGVWNESSAGEKGLLKLRHVESDSAGATIAIHAALGAGAVVSLGPKLLWQQDSLIDDGITIARIETRGHVRVDVARSTELVVIAVRAGEVVAEERGVPLRLTDGQLTLVPLGGSVRLEWSSARLDLFSFPAAPLARLLGVGAAEVQLQTPRREPRNEVLTAYFDRAARLLTDETFEREEIFQRDLIRANAIELLAATIIEAFDIVNRTERATDRDQAVVRRAVMFMRRHLRDPISIPEIAEVAGVSIRGLQMVFRRQLDTTPLMHLRQLRLEAARQELLANADRGTTVAAVAASYGYSNPARFSTHYRNAFHHSPAADVTRLTPDEDDPAASAAVDAATEA